MREVERKWRKKKGRKGGSEKCKELGREGEWERVKSVSCCAILKSICIFIYSTAPVKYCKKFQMHTFRIPRTVEA